MQEQPTGWAKLPGNYEGYDDLTADFATYDELTAYMNAQEDQDG